MTSEWLADLEREASQRIDTWRRARGGESGGYVASDLAELAPILRSLAEQGSGPGERFLEWGSGAGTVAILAAELGFDVWGIEHEPELVTLAEELAADFESDARFVVGTLVPAGCTAPRIPPFASPEEGETDAYAELGSSLAEFDVVYAYPWPGEADCLRGIFRESARDGAWLILAEEGYGWRGWEKREEELLPRDLH